MMFDSKRREARDAEAGAAMLAEAPEATRSIAPDDVRSMAPGADRLAARDACPEDVRQVVGVDDPVEAHRRGDDDLEPLFPAEVAQNFRRSWDAVQIGFVDDPPQTVRKADELVNQVLRGLSETFAEERGRVQARVARADPVSTEDLRVALQRYRSFMHRLLSL